MNSTVSVNKKKTRMIAHRGLSGIERENTCPAFIAAANRSYYGIETDVHVNVNGEFIIIHDDTTYRVAGGKYRLNVEETSFDELSDIVLPDLDGTFDRGDVRIPKLSDYIKICKKYDKRAVLELKNPFVKEDIKLLVEEIDRLDYLNGVTFISFSFDNCIALRELLPDAEIQWLTSDAVTDDTVGNLLRYSFGLDIYYKCLDHETVDMLHNKGITVNCWTCDSPDDANELIGMGVDYITTNILE